MISTLSEREISLHSTAPYLLKKFLTSFLCAGSPVSYKIGEGVEFGVGGGGGVTIVLGLSLFFQSAVHTRLGLVPRPFLPPPPPSEGLPNPRSHLSWLLPSGRGYWLLYSRRRHKLLLRSGRRRARFSTFTMTMSSFDPFHSHKTAMGERSTPDPSRSS